MIELDGSAGEGGGQILRSALALSMCTGKPMRIEHIRAKRPKPGLMRQHLTCVQAAAQMCDAQVEGAELGSQCLTFKPGSVKAGEYNFAVGSAGSCTLVLQTVLPPLMLAKATSTIHLSGGTHNPMAPPFHFLQRSFAPQLARMGVGLQLAIKRHGFYPAGGGEITAQIMPALEGLLSIELMGRGALKEMFIESVVAGVPGHVAERELMTVAKAMGWPEGIDGTQQRLIKLAQGEGPGNVLMATVVHEHVTEVMTRFGEKTVSAEQVAKRLINDVRQYQRSVAPVGEHLADQLMVPMALSAGVGSGKFIATMISEHARTNAAVIEQFLPVRFEMKLVEQGFEVSVSKCLN
jgi:RNA 3'-terminal phosphate cyclase (ATP)